MNATPKQPARTGESGSRSGQVSTPVPAQEGGGRATQGREGSPRAGHAGAGLPARATTKGPCPTCGHHGPRIVLCYDPVCLHSLYGHEINKDGSRGACLSASAAAGRCPCKKAVPNKPEDPETPRP